MQAHIRAFTPQDYSAVANVYNAVWQGPTITAEQLRRDDEAIQHHGEATWRRYVIEYDQRIVAFGCIDQPPRFYGPGWFRVTVSVEPRYQRQGFGSALYDTLIEGLQSLTARTIWVRIREDMCPGLSFVEQLGSYEERYRVFQADIEALKSCDMCVALLSGQGHDSGTSAELGYLYALGKLCIGITDDKRGYLNTIIWGICGYGKQIVGTVDELLEMVRSM